MKLLVTGATGLVGSNVVRAARRRGLDVVAIVSPRGGAVPDAGTVIPVDLGNEHAVQRAVLDVFPDAIVNAAAVSEVHLCDAEPARSQRLNVDLPTSLAQLAHHLGARLVHLSSEQVFDGRAAPYRRTDPVSPISLYGRQKAESEQAVVQSAPELGLALRLPLLGGNSPRGDRSLNERLFHAWAAGRRTRLFRDEIRQPCSAENVAEVIVELCERNDLKGIHHWAGAAPISRLEMGRQLASYFRLPAEDLIEEAAQADDPAGAKRQPDLSLDCAPLAGLLKTRPETFAALLDRLIVPEACRMWWLRTAGPSGPIIA